MIELIRATYKFCRAILHQQIAQTSVDPKPAWHPATSSHHLATFTRMLSAVALADTY